MKKTAFALVATVALTGAFATGVSAHEYTVNKGDTLWGISQENNVSVDKLKELNNLSSDLIVTNQTLTISGESKKEQKETYTVKSGDTLFGIGEEFNVSVDQLMAWNGLSSSLIHPGDEFTVKGGVVNETPAAPEPKETASEPTEEKAAAEEAASAEQTSTSENSSSKQSTSNDVIKEINVEATAYTANCNGCSGVTATGIDLNKNPNQKVIAVDPNVIPLGSKVYVEGYGTAIAGDTGGAINGNKIDLYMQSRGDALNFGRQSVNVQVLSQ
ncbi:LysM peptidoglycan-binding domain-containing protein [Halobacillus seohaensis]|uniref:LysM peptidoglycan-binding domain-containing protein n=1 Tax=Halobacillus seohaensis TaxID=447421 RepID=A0ABW2EFZ5_9BACI